MFLASLFAGMIIVEARIVILASVSSVALTSFMSYLLLTMPVFLGRLGQPALENIVVELALVTVFTSLFPVPVVVAIVGGVVGGLLSERLGLF